MSKSIVFYLCLSRLEMSTSIVCYLCLSRLEMSMPLYAHDLIHLILFPL